MNDTSPQETLPPCPCLWWDGWVYDRDEEAPLSEEVYYMTENKRRARR